MNVLVTGATGYVGGRLIPRLLEAGHSVRALARDPRRLIGRRSLSGASVVSGDLLDPNSLEPAFDGIDVAYYLVHSLGSSSDFAERDRTAALNFVRAARRVARVVYLGFLMPDSPVGCEHLRSRAEVGDILRRHLPTLELRAGPIIGSGSASFEMVRYLTERLPLMIAPAWVENVIQPIAVRDALEYLTRALDSDATGVIDIGAEPLTFRRMMEIYGEVRGLRRRVLPVPVLAPSLAARWVGLVTPLPNRLAVGLVHGVLQDLRADRHRARKVFPEVRPLPYRRAVELALRRIEAQDVSTRWSGALGAAQAFEFENREGLLREERAVEVRASPDMVYESFAGLGGERGWPAFQWAWQVRGFIDRLVGGPGLRRGRRHAHHLEVGEALDFWRVEVNDPPWRLRLRAEMRLPGRGWLQWDVEPAGTRSLLRQTAVFAPYGLWGTVYWACLYPFHRPIFARLVRAIAADAEARAADADEAVAEPVSQS